MTLGVISVVQARMGSSRLRGKSMLQVGNKLLIDHVIERALNSKEVARVYLATTNLSEDDVLASHVSENYPVLIHRGSDLDVRSRFLEILTTDEAEIVVRITADDPFKDPNETDVLVRMLKSEKLDYICNFAPQSMPVGLDVEVFTSLALFDSAAHFITPQDKEHVTWNMRTQRYKWRSQKSQIFRPDIRLTVDNQSDLYYCSEIANIIHQNMLGQSFTDTCRAIEIREGQEKK